MAKDNIVWDDVPAGDGIVWDEPAPIKKLSKSLGRQAAESFLPQNIAKSIYGVAETGTQMATALPAQALGGLRGIASIVAGEGADEAARKVRATEQALTYQPRSQAGQALSGALGTAAEAINVGVGKAGGAVGEAVGGETGRNIGEALGEIAVPVAGTLAGGGGVLRAARGKTVGDVAQAAREVATDIAETPTYFKKSRQRAPTKAQVEQSMRTADTIDITNRGIDLGLKVDPAQTAPTVGNRLLRSVAGPEDLNEALAAANRQRGTEIVKRDLGIAPNAEINMDTITAMRNQADLPNQYIRKLGGQVTVDAPTVGEIGRLKVSRPVVGEEAAAGAVNRLVDSLSERINSGSMTAPEIMEHIRVFRENARDLRSKTELTTADRQLASTNRALADALESSVERNLQRLARENPTHGYDRLLSDFRQGRTDMARSYLLEDVLDKQSGTIDFRKLSKEVADNPAVSGELRTVGEFAGRYPEVFTSMERPGRSVLEKHIITRTTIPGMVVGGILGGGTPAGVAAGAVANKALSVGARRILTGEGRQHAARPVDYRPAEMRGRPAQPLLNEDVLPPGPPRHRGPITFAPEGPLPTTRANIEPTVRPTLELAPMEEAGAMSQALRGARTPLSRGPVEFTPGEAVNFPLRQEVITSPEISTAVDNFRMQAADLENKIANSQGFWKNRYEAQLAALQEEFGAGMKQLGVRSPQEAIGYQSLYEGGGNLRLPIEQSFDPRPAIMGPYLPAALRNRR